METKKSKRANLENKRLIIFQTGLVIALSLVLLAFEWNTAKYNSNDLGSLQNVDVEEEIIPITRPETPPPPPPPPRAIEDLIVVGDDVNIEEEIKIEDSEIDQDTQVTPIFYDDDEQEVEAPTFYIVEDMPKFPEGDKGLRRYIAENIVYPEIAKESNIQGRVFVQFVVNTKGEVEQAKVVRGVDYSLDKEALRIIKGLPKWEPGKQRGKPVKVQFTVPINFVLQ